ncbi:uncharacterized protein LOC115622457 isoform X2 [Scaptodrosophila lebanonensis]|nr:uncharacterized protein LOC115622457 isoform X2 [Scaptodrosophila lebanonensis]
MQTMKLTRAFQEPPGDNKQDDCKICGARFDNIKECMAHELRQHSNNPKRAARQLLNTVAKVINSDKNQAERKKLQEVLELAKPFKELSALLGFYACDKQKLTNCFGHVRNCIEREFRCRVKVFAFGSLVTGLALRDSDLDLYVKPDDDQLSEASSKQLFNMVTKFLHRSNCFTDVFAIRHARVPIIKCKHQLTGLSLDINMSNPNSLYNSRFVCDLINMDQRLRELFIFLKVWAKSVKLIGHGSMTSYCLITLIIYYLQQRYKLPSINEMQAHCEPMLVWGINYAYNLTDMKPLPELLKTQDLIAGFFEFYTNMDFEKIVITPYLGRALDRKGALDQLEQYPEYVQQMRAIETHRGEPPEMLQTQRCVCVQDPFELNHNVAKTISSNNLIYLRQCLALASQAVNDRKLQTAPPKLFDYLLFGLTEEIIREINSSARPAKLRKQPASVIELDKNGSQKGEPQSQNEQRNQTEEQTNGGSLHISHVTNLRPTSNELKCLRTEFIAKNLKTEHTFYYYWMQFYVDVIQEMLTHIYAMKLEPVESEPSDKTLPLQLNYTWHITTSLNTWAARNFQRTKDGSFFEYQRTQTLQYLRERQNKSAYTVNLQAILSLRGSEDYKDIRIELKPMPDDPLGLQRNSPLTKFFKSFKNLLNSFSFKEKYTEWNGKHSF